MSFKDKTCSGDCRCGVGLQKELMPWAAVAFVLYSLVWPIWLFWILRRNRELIKEDQLLRAMDLGETRETNPDAYEIRKRYHKMHVFAVSLCSLSFHTRERSLAVKCQCMPHSPSSPPFC